MTPQETLTRRQLFENFFERVKQTTVVAPLLAACAPSPSLQDGRVESSSDGWQHFVSSSHPYEIYFPPGWIVDK